jgi:hypothetical protein
MIGFFREERARTPSEQILYQRILWMAEILRIVRFSWNYDIPTVNAFEPESDDGLQPSRMS